jgi:NADH-quinone oxidoreductase subunit A
MASALETSVGVVGYLALFGSIGFAFIFINLLVGRYLRPHNPYKEKLEIYECGEPAIGSSFVQFDLRFYVVALVFIIFDVEVAFLFPWATVFGKLSSLAHDPRPLVASAGDTPSLSPAASGVYRELGVDVATASGGAFPSEQALRYGQFGSDGQLEFAGLEQMMAFAFVAVAVFFVVLLVGFAYEWRTGALDWVRAMTPHAGKVAVDRPAAVRGGRQESVLSA